MAVFRCFGSRTSVNGAGAVLTAPGRDLAADYRAEYESGDQVWADNETEIDLLGFDFLVDSLVVALTEPRLLPLTVGVLGDWGSGKSSLLRLVREALPTAPLDEHGGVVAHYVCIDFSPWQFEHYEDVKVALMTSVLDRLRGEAPTDELKAEVGRLQRFVGRLRRSGRAGAVGALHALPATLPAIAAAVDPSIDPSLVAVAQQAVNSAIAEATSSPVASSESNAIDVEPIDVVTFRRELARLIAGLESVLAVVVFVDDLDRCLPDTVVDTFETIRLFLNTPKTAYVVAANQRVIESSVDARYPGLRDENGEGLGSAYLEKMFQMKVAVPALSPPEAETYMNLLLAELHLSADEFAKVRGEAAKQRSDNNLQVAFNLGVAADVLDTVPAPLIEALDWAATIAPGVTTGSRGNPRQLKRFLNSLLLKRASAARRGVDLNAAVLAKLMLLEDEHVSDFQQLFDWQILADGPCTQLAEAERVVLSIPNGGDSDGPPAPSSTEEQSASQATKRTTATKSRTTAADGPKPATPSRSRESDAVSPEVRSWVDRPHVGSWLSLPPRLGQVDLRPYFTYSRDKLSLGTLPSRLPTQLQALLVGIQAEQSAKRRSALDAVAALAPDQRFQLLEPLLAALVRQPHGNALTGAVELAERAPDTAVDVVKALARIPPAAMPPNQITAVVRRIPAETHGLPELLDAWQNSDESAVSTMTRTARSAQGRR